MDRDISYCYELEGYALANPPIQRVACLPITSDQPSQGETESNTLITNHHRTFLERSRKVGVKTVHRVNIFL